MQRQKEEEVRDSDEEANLVRLHIDALTSLAQLLHSFPFPSNIDSQSVHCKLCARNCAIGARFEPNRSTPPGTDNAPKVKR